MTKNKKGSAYLLLYGFIFMGLLAVTYIAFNQIVENEFTDILYDESLNFSDEDKSEAGRFKGAWIFMAFFLAFIVLMFWLVHIGITNGDGG